MSKAATGKGGAVLATRALSFPWQTKVRAANCACHAAIACAALPLVPALALALISAGALKKAGCHPLLHH